MQNSILLNDALQVRPTGIDIEDGIQAIKSATKREAKRLWATKSEPFSYLCEETVTYGEVVKTIVGIVSFVCVMIVGGYLFGGEVM